jgi:hypothetical protein
MEHQLNIRDLEHFMIEERQSDQIHVIFLACTDDPSFVDYLNEWDRKICI